MAAIKIYGVVVRRQGATLRHNLFIGLVEYFSEKARICRKKNQCQ